MTTQHMGYKNADVHGRASFEVLDDYAQQHLLAGAEPALMPAVSVLLGDSLNLPQFQVVGLTGGRLVKAVYHATLSSGVKPIGVLAHGAVSGSSNSTVYGQVWLTACFNADDQSPLVWDTSFDTLVKKTQWEGLVGNPALIFRSRKAQ